MQGAGGTVDDKPLPEVIEGLRALLRAIDDGRMTCSPAYRNRLQGAILVLEAVNGGPSNEAFVRHPWRGT